MNGNALSLGRNHASADSVSIIDLGDRYRVDVRWNDGAWVYAIYGTETEAREHARSLGWA